jgi:hypothetical protein
VIRKSVGQLEKYNAVDNVTRVKAGLKHLKFDGLEMIHPDIGDIILS